MGDQGRVLLVEDDEAIRRLMAEVLSARGYVVDEVGDGLSALGAVLALRPDVVLLDIGLPGLDGFGVLAQLKDHAQTAQIPVVMVTAWAEPELVSKALDRGAHDYIRKPFDIAELGARVDAAARVKARQDALHCDNDRLAELAALDTLTALPNRRALDQELERQCAAAQRSMREFSVLMLDIDHFKAVNDTYGHGVGDALLRAIARRLAVRVRSTDTLGRWGGEEFMVVLPDTDGEGAARVAEDLRALLASRPLDTASAAVRITASIGVATSTGETAGELIERCDRALYDAKASGRDAVGIAAAPEPALRLAA